MPTEREVRGRLLTALARAAIAADFGAPAPALPHPAWLDEQAATFVTLTLHERLRGCIGSIEASRSLYEDVTHNARAAAHDDPRFPPLTADELPDVRIEVSVLSAPRPFPFRSEADALRRLRPGLDGVVLQCGRRRGVFLPQVWEQLPEPREFLARLKEKAGLPRDFSADDLQLSVFQVEAFRAD